MSGPGILDTWPISFMKIDDESLTRDYSIAMLKGGGSRPQQPNYGCSDFSSFTGDGFGYGTGNVKGGNNAYIQNFTNDICHVSIDDFIVWMLEWEMSNA